MESLLKNATTDASLHARLHGERVVFFLHLLGLDMYVCPFRSVQRFSLFTKSIMCFILQRVFSGTCFGVDMHLCACSLITQNFSYKRVIRGRVSTCICIQKEDSQEYLTLFAKLIPPPLTRNGHAHRPHSKQYYENIASVDSDLEVLEARLAAFYNDTKTAFVFTSDHGMSNKGSHGQ